MPQLNLPSDNTLTMFSGSKGEFPRDAIIILLVSIAIHTSQIFLLSRH